MDLDPSIAISSVAGAIFFFTGGRLSSRRTPAGADARGALEAEEAKVSALRRELAAARVVGEDEKARGAELTRALHAERAAREGADRAAKTAIERLESEGAALMSALEAERAARADAERAAKAEIDRLARDGAAVRAQAAEVTAQLAELRARLAKGVATMTSDLDDARASLQQALVEKQRLVEEVAAAKGRDALLQKETERRDKGIADLQRRLEASRRRAVEADARLADADHLRRENDRLEVAVNALARERADEAASKDAENAALRRRVQALEGAASEVDELRRRVRDLEALGLAERLEEPAPRSRPPAEGAALETLLERELGRLVDGEEGCRAAVLSDTSGLLIASSRHAVYPDELAAAASIAAQSAERLRALLPLGDPASLELCDVNGLSLRTRWMRIGDERFLVNTVGVLEEPDDTADLRSRIGELLMGGA